MTRLLSADYIYPIHDSPVRNGVVEVNGYGEIVQVHRTSKGLDQSKIEKYKGIIVPGFVNAHCHLELSHLRNQIESGLGLTKFLKRVVSRPAVTEATILEAMELADKEMEENGIVAVGDISNTLASKPVKQKSNLYYHTFVEVLCFEPDKAKEVFKNGIELCEQFMPLSSSITPHAPYSVCKELFRFIKIFCDNGHNLLSIHNQESDEENKFYRYKRGAFVEFYQSLNKNIDFFKAQARNSLRAIVPLLPQTDHILMVHNTYTSYKDTNFMDRYGRQVTWCFCPNANLYIEDRLPNIPIFRDGGKKIVLGTDSLASNKQLSILEEIKTIQAQNKEIPLTELFRWGTLNGAEYFGISDRFGSIEPGKRPGLNLVENISGSDILAESSVRKLL